MNGLFSTWAVVCTSPYEAVLFHAAALVAFFGALRISELVAQSKSDQSTWALLAQDVRFAGGQVILTIRGSKTAQRQVRTTLTLSTCGDQQLCPVVALQNYMGTRGWAVGFLFRHQDGTSLTKHQFWAITSRVLTRLDLAGVKFGTHSFTISAASTALVLDYRATSIQYLGHWKSSCYKGYIRC